METKLFTTKIRGRVYAPMAGKVMYMDDEVGVPLATDDETRAEMGWKYTVASPLSPYVLGGEKHRMLVAELKNNESLSDAFRAEVDWEKNEVTVYRRGVV